MMPARFATNHYQTILDILLQIFIFVSTQKKVIGCVVADQIEKVLMLNLPIIMVCII